MCVRASWALLSEKLNRLSVLLVFFLARAINVEVKGVLGLSIKVGARLEEEQRFQYTRCGNRKNTTVAESEDKNIKQYKRS